MTSSLAVRVCSDLRCSGEHSVQIVVMLASQGLLLSLLLLDDGRVLSLLLKNWGGVGEYAFGH